MAELSLWFNNASDNEALMTLTAFLIGRGAAPNGRATCLKTEDVPKGFEGLRDHDSVEREFSSLEDLKSLVADNRLVPVGLEFQDVFTFETKNAVEVVLDRTNEPSFHHPVTILVDDAEIFGIIEDPIAPRPAGTETMGLLKAIVDELEVSYAAIFNERPMHSPTDLQLDEARFYRDFFAADDFLGPTATANLLAKASGSATRLERGVLISTTPQLGGDGANVETAARFFVQATIALGRRS